MSDTKNNNVAIIAAIVAILVIGGGAMFYFSKNMTNEGAPAVATSTDAPEAVETNSAEAPAPEQTAAPVASAEQEATDNAGGEIGGVAVEPGNPVVAKVDGRDITRVDVFNFIKLMPGNIQQLPPAAVYPLALDQVVNTRLVQNKAEEAGLENDPEVKEQLDMARQQIIRTVYVQREVDKSISSSDLRSAYNDYVKQIPDQQEIHARHILVADEATARDLISQLKNGGDFAALAAQYSGDPGNKDKGGDLGWFTPQDMVPEFSEAAVKIAKGQVGEAPVKTQFGWHVVKVEDKRSRAKPTFDEMKPMLQVELRREQLEKKLESWRKAANVEIFDINGKPRQTADIAAPAAAEPAQSEPAAGAEEEAPAAAE